MWKAFLRGVWTMLPDFLLPAWLGVHPAEQCQFRGPFLKTRRQEKARRPRSSSICTLDRTVLKRVWKCPGQRPL